MKKTNDMTTSSDQPFTSLELHESLLKNLASLGYDFMTPIQSKSLPVMLHSQDVIAQANTGTGKTAAFGLSLLHHLNVEQYAVQALVLCPTRELAEQVSASIRQLARMMHNVKVLNLSGGAALRPQVDSLRHGAHIVVGTPGRVKKHLDNSTLSLKHLKTLVLDEADRMLDMGFFDAIKDIINICPKKRQTLLFSATYPAEIKQLASEFMINPIKISVESANSNLDIEQLFYEVSSHTQKYPLLKSLLLHHQPAATLIFCNTKELTTQLTSLLIKDGFSATALNGDMEQIDRDMTIIRFRNQSCSILVATDVAARGLDIKELPAVINYEIAFEHDVHIHRIGRTGRAGCKGLALSITTPADAQRLCAIEDNLNKAIKWENKETLNTNNKTAFTPDMTTLCLSAGRRDKLRPGDILGALTKDAGLPGEAIGKIDITTINSFVAIKNNFADKALQYLQNGKIKGRKVTVKKIR